MQRFLHAGCFWFQANSQKQPTIHTSTWSTEPSWQTEVSKRVLSVIDRFSIRHRLLCVHDSYSRLCSALSAEWEEIWLASLDDANNPANKMKNRKNYVEKNTPQKKTQNTNTASSLAGCALVLTFAPREWLGCHSGRLRPTRREPRLTMPTRRKSAARTISPCARHFELLVHFK